MTDSTPQAALRRLLEGFTPRDDEGQIWSQESIRIDVELPMGVIGGTASGRPCPDRDDG